MVGRIIRRYCHECGAPLSKVLNSKNTKIVWEEDHVCDPKKRVKWKLYEQENILLETTKSFTIKHAFEEKGMTKQGNHYILRCKNCGEEIYIKKKFRGGLYDISQYSYGCKQTLLNERAKESEHGI